jgi:ferredoxin
VRVQVDSTRCQGHTLCAMIAPETFELDDVDGHAHPVVENVPATQRQTVLDAAKSCPEQAITVMVEQSTTGRGVHGQRPER